MEPIQTLTQPSRQRGIRSRPDINGAQRDRKPGECQCVSAGVSSERRARLKMEGENFGCCRGGPLPRGAGSANAQQKGARLRKRHLGATVEGPWELVITCTSGRKVTYELQGSRRASRTSPRAACHLVPPPAIGRLSRRHPDAPGARRTQAARTAADWVLLQPAPEPTPDGNGRRPTPRSAPAPRPGSVLQQLAPPRDLQGHGPARGIRAQLRRNAGFGSDYDSGSAHPYIYGVYKERVERLTLAVTSQASVQQDYPLCREARRPDVELTGTACNSAQNRPAARLKGGIVAVRKRASWGSTPPSPASSAANAAGKRIAI